ncbi:MAG: tetratricopeptide repeat-containing protein [Paracoccaceae bacterium]
MGRSDHIPMGRAADPATERTAALKAGWHAADLDWERLQEEGNALLCSGDRDGAARCFRRAGWIALWHFLPTDPRRATTLANLGLADRLAGREGRARRRYARARRIWGAVGGFIGAMRIARRARSSLFHLRMEARHWDTYQANMRTRMTAFAAETAAALAALERGQPPACRLFERWRAEKPPVYDDTRKILAAALLIAVWGKR